MFTQSDEQQLKDTVQTVVSHLTDVDRNFQLICNL